MAGLCRAHRCLDTEAIQCSLSTYWHVFWRWKEIREPGVNRGTHGEHMQRMCVGRGCPQIKGLVFVLVIKSMGHRIRSSFSFIVNSTLSAWSRGNGQISLSLKKTFCIYLSNAGSRHVSMQLLLPSETPNYVLRKYESVTPWFMTANPFILNCKSMILYIYRALHV